MQNNVIRIYPECPIDLTLAFVEGKPVKGGKMMFSGVDGRVLFVPEAEGRDIQRRLNDLRIQPGDQVLIRQSISFEPAGQKEVKWEVHRAVVSCGQQADGSFVVPSQPGAASETAPARIHASVTAKASTLAHSGSAAAVREQATFLVDVYAQALRYSKEAHGEAVTPADVREFVLAAYRCYRGGVR